MKGIAALGGLTALLLLPQTPSTPSAATAAEGFGAATLPRRDAVDARLAREVSERSGRLIDSQEEVGGWPDYRAAGKLPGAR